MEIRQAMWWNFTAETTRKICLKICVFGAVTGVTYGYNSLMGAADPRGRTIEHVAIESVSLQADSGDNQLLAAVIRPVPVAQPVETAKPADPPTMQVKPAGSGKQAAARIRTSKARSNMAAPMQPSDSTSDRPHARRETRWS